MATNSTFWRKWCTLSMLCFSSYAGVRGQSVTITGTTSCPPVTFTINNTVPSSIVVIRRNGVVVDTLSASLSYGVTVAGDRNCSFGSDSTKLQGNRGIFVDTVGNVYVADADNNRVQKWAPGASYGVTVAGDKNGTFGYDSTKLYQPWGVVVDNNGNVYVCDRSNNRVQKWAPGAAYGVTVAGHSDCTSGYDSTGLYVPSGICLDANNNLYVAEYGNNRITKWAPGATYGTTVAGNSGGLSGTDSNLLYIPQAVWADTSGVVYAADYGNHRIQKWTTGINYGTTVAGSSSGTFGTDSTKFHYATGVFVDPYNNVYVADYHNNRVQRWAPGASYGVTVAGSSTCIVGVDSSKLNYPSAVFVRSGSIYVSDQQNSRVQKWDAHYSFTASQGGEYTATAVTLTTAVSSNIFAVSADTFRGATSTDWNTASNWSCAVVPGSTTAVVIPHISNQPVIGSGSAAAFDLTLDSAATLTINNGASLNTGGTATINGHVNGAGALILNGTTLQSIISNNGTVSNLSLNNSSGATIPTGDTLNLSGSYTPSSGSLNVNGSLVLLSDASGTATVNQGPSTGGYISGNVTVQRFIPGGRKADRFLSHPFSSSIALNELTNSIDITGNGGSTNGFTTTATNTPSSFWYDPTTGNGSFTDPGWIAFGNTNGLGTDAWKQYQGIRVLLRGAKGEGLTSTTYTPSSTTLSANGPLNQGDQVVPLIHGASSDYNLIGNPFPCQVDLSTITRASNVGANFWVWDPRQASAGAWVSNPFSSSYILPSFSAFETTASSVTGNTITFHESDKTSATPHNLFKVTGPLNNMIQLRILSNNDSVSWDRLLLYLDNNGISDSDALDATKRINPDVNFYTFSTNAKPLSIDVRPYLSGQVIPLGFKSPLMQNFNIKVQDLNIPTGAFFYLHDKYLNQLQPLSIGAEYSFTVTSDTASQGDNRFEINISDTALGVSNSSSTLSLFTATLSPNPATGKISLNYSTSLKSNIVVQLSDIKGGILYTSHEANKGKGTIYINLQDITPGLYFIKTICDNNSTTQSFIKQ